MTGIKTFYIWRLPNDTHLTANRRFRDFASQSAGVNTHLALILAAYREAIATEDLYMHQLRGSELTEVIAKIDAERDATYYVVNHMVDVFLHYPDGQMKTDAVKVEKYLKANGVDVAAQYDRETGMIANLVQDLEQYCTDEINRLGLTEQVGRLKELNEQMYDLMQDRFKQGAGKELNAVSNARKRTDLLYRSLVAATNAFVVVDEAAFIEFVRDANQYIDYLNLQVFKITGSSADKNEVDGFQPGTGDGNNGTEGGENENNGNENNTGNENNGGGNTGITTPGGSIPANPQPGTDDDPDL